MTVPFRYLRLGFATLYVTNLKKSVEFYRDIVGLQYVEGNDHEAYFRCSNSHHNVVLIENPQHGLRRIGFELETPNDVDLAYEHFKSLGFAPKYLTAEQLKKSKCGKAIRVVEKATQLEFELFASPIHMSTPFVPTLAKIARIGHIVVNAKEGEVAKDQLVDNFGFRISDFIEDNIYFLRCHPNPFHHSFGIGPGSETRFHHMNFMVSDMDDIGQAIYRMKKHDVKVVFGPGRHPPSNSIFFYFLDPDGMTVEYSFGMEEFPEFEAREPRNMEPVLASMDVWGAVPDPAFGKSGPIIFEES